MNDVRAKLDAIFAALAIREPTAVDRAAGLLEAKRIWDAIHPQSKRGGDRRSKKFRGQDQTDKLSFCSIAAERIGLTERSVFRDVALAEALGDELLLTLRDSRIADNAMALRLIAELDPRDRRSVINALDELSFREALVKTGIRRALDPQEAFVQSIIARLPSFSPRSLRRVRDAVDHELRRKTRGAK